ncbi:MAG TPA: hypothetical protein VIC27_14655, partial [Ktedonobacterales bacterium]
ELSADGDDGALRPIWANRADVGHVGAQPHHLGVVVQGAQPLFPRVRLRDHQMYRVATSVYRRNWSLPRPSQRLTILSPMRGVSSPMRPNSPT